MFYSCHRNLFKLFEKSHIEVDTNTKYRLRLIVLFKYPFLYGGCSLSKRVMRNSNHLSFTVLSTYENFVFLSYGICFVCYRSCCCFLTIVYIGVKQWLMINESLIIMIHVYEKICEKWVKEWSRHNVGIFFINILKVKIFLLIALLIRSQ